MKIVALDFETANQYPQSACSLGISIYQDGEILDSFEYYFKPSERYNFFTNTYIHGIKQSDVEDKDEFIFYYDRLVEILKDSVIVAHNARFDLNVLNSLCDLYGLNRFENYYLDTVKISRLVYPELYNHKLNTICDYLDIDLDHHNGKSDALACLMILLKAMEAYQTYDLDTFLKQLKICLKKNI